MKLFFEHSNK